MSEHYCTYKDGMCELDIDEAYQQGRADALSEKTDDVLKSNFNTEMFKACLDSANQCGYQQGKADAIKECISIIDKIMPPRPIITKSKHYENWKMKTTELRMLRDMFEQMQKGEE